MTTKKVVTDSDVQVAIDAILADPEIAAEAKQIHTSVKALSKRLVKERSLFQYLSIK